MNTKFIISTIILSMFIIGTVAVFAILDLSMQQQLTDMNTQIIIADRKTKTNQITLKELAMQQTLIQNQIALNNEKINQTSQLALLNQINEAAAKAAAQNQPVVTPAVTPTPKVVTPTPVTKTVKPKPKPVVVRNTRAS